MSAVVCHRVIEKELMKLDLNGSGMYKQAAEGATRFSLLYPLSVLNYIHDPNKDTFKS